MHLNLIPVGDRNDVGSVSLMGTEDFLAFVEGGCNAALNVRVVVVGALASATVAGLHTRERAWVLGADAVADLRRLRMAYPGISWLEH